MNSIALRAEAALRRHPHPALRLGELVALIADDIDRGLTPARLRPVLEDHPERFKVLDASIMRWGADPSGAGVGDADADAWAIAIHDPDEPPDLPPQALRLRESVRWLGRGIDPRSPMEISRWYAIVLAERAVRAAVVRKAA